MRGGMCRRKDAMRARFVVDHGLCIGCGLCHERAPENIDVPLGAMAAVVTKQPADVEEEAACIEAAEFCPTGGLKLLPARHVEPAQRDDDISPPTRFA